MTDLLRIGIWPGDALLTGDPEQRRRLVRHIEDAGLDFVSVGDHVSFHDGTGFDGVVAATTLLATSDRLPVLIGVYLLGLRHPVPAWRSFATLAQVAPGRVLLGVGVGGEDRREVTNSGVDPRTRGRRVDESLLVIRALQDGRAIDHRGEFFALEQARIVPAPNPRIPIVIGGRADAAITRTARYGDGWLGVFCSPRRYAETKRRIEEEAVALDRAVPDWFGLTVWCGLDDAPGRARALLDERLESLYKLPGDRFARVAFAGTPAQVAEQLEPYVAAGARHLSIIPAASTPLAAVDHVATIAGHLRGTRT